MGGIKPAQGEDGKAIGGIANGAVLHVDGIGPHGVDQAVWRAVIMVVIAAPGMATAGVQLARSGGGHGFAGGGLRRALGAGIEDRHTIDGDANGTGHGLGRGGGQRGVPGQLEFQMMNGGELLVIAGDADHYGLRGVWQAVRLKGKLAFRAGKTSDLIGKGAGVTGVVGKGVFDGLGKSGASGEQGSNGGQVVRFHGNFPGVKGVIG
jgi:hypothetical protein